MAICDSNLIGKKFEEGNFQLDVKEAFFNGKEANEKEVLNVIERMQREDATFNIIGRESVNTALKAGIINKEGIKTIQNIPFSMVLL